MKIFRKIGIWLVYVFAFIGFTFTSVFVAMKLHLTNTSGSADIQTDFFKNQAQLRKSGAYIPPTNQAWMNTEEWSILKDAIIKDKVAILKASAESHVPARMIVAEIVPEQLRLYSSEREIFKQIFSPLRVLGTQTQFSLGVTGIKLETAQAIEEHLKDKSSPYYLGSQYEHKLDFVSSDIENERLNRLTDYGNHYFSYLYTGLFVKQIASQWKSAGYNIDDRPEILSTLFNIGFSHSTPNSNPSAGGAEIDIGNGKYTFGGVAYDFYYSGELINDFPIPTGNDAILTK